MHSAQVVLLSPAHIYKPRIEMTFHIGGKGSHMRRLSFESMVQLSMSVYIVSVCNIHITVHTSFVRNIVSYKNVNALTVVNSGQQTLKFRHAILTFSQHMHISYDKCENGGPNQ